MIVYLFTIINKIRHSFFKSTISSAKIAQFRAKTTKPQKLKRHSEMLQISLISLEKDLLEVDGVNVISVRSVTRLVRVTASRGCRKQMIGSLHPSRDRVGFP